MLLQYMLQLSACYAAVYIFYWLVLRRLTSYKSNRFYLLLMALFAFVMPLLRLDVFISPQTLSTSGIINYMPAINVATAADKYVHQTSATNISLVLITVFFSGVAVLLVHFIMQLISFKKVTANTSLISDDAGIKLYHVEMDIMPFSFGKSVYVNKQKHTQAELNDIIKHESVHAQQQHSIDVILAELICVLNWYNPFVWLIKYAIKQNLEFLADDTVINKGVDKKNYQYLLLKVTGYTPLNIANNLKISSLKQRIYMMNKTRTSQKHLLKLLLMLPLFAFIMLAFRNTNTPVTNTTIGTVKEDTFILTELTYNIPNVNIDGLVKKAQDKSLLQIGKPLTISLIINEKDRLKVLLEKNGYSNIGDHAIRFLIDTTQANNRFSIQVNIDLQKKDVSVNNINKTTGNTIAGNPSTYLKTSDSRSSETALKLAETQPQAEL